MTLRDLFITSMNRFDDEKMSVGQNQDARLLECSSIIFLSGEMF